MPQTLSDFLGGYQRGVEVAVAGGSADELLGIREAFRRYFHDGLDRPVPVAVVAQEGAAAGRESRAPIAKRSPGRVAPPASSPSGSSDTYQFYVATEACVERFRSTTASASSCAAGPRCSVRRARRSLAAVRSSCLTLLSNAA
jgi:hypothetical protein